MSNTDNQRENTGRNTDGRFAAGNPGRPYGAKGKASREALEYIKAMKPTALQKLWESVSKGEKWAVQLVLSKVLPTSRTIEFEGLTPQDIKAALAAGDISPEEAKMITNITRNLSDLEFLELIRGRRS